MTAELVQERKEAVARGDKAAGRNAYHQLQEAGYQPSELDATTFTDEIPEPKVVVPNPEPEVAVAPSNDPAAVKAWEKCQALRAELGSVEHAKTGNPRRAKEVKVQLKNAEKELAALTEPDAPETTQAPEAPEKAVKPAPKRRTKSE